MSIYNVCFCGERRKIMIFFFFIENITKTCLYNFDLLKPHSHIVKMGFTGVYIIFLISAQKHRLWVPTIYDVSRNMNNIWNFLS